jgi:hypothetical protein
LNESKSVFTQAVPRPNGQEVSPGPHTLEEHEPPKHVCPAAQRLPQAPQLLTSNDVFTQAEPPSAGQLVRPDKQPHAPLVQVCPNEHAFPHAPQLLGSDDVNTQAPPQAVDPGGHTTLWHRPAKHVSLAAHARPHEPQLFSSKSVFTQALPPSVGQLVSPAKQLHAPLEQNCPIEHALPHEPQLLLSIAVFVHTGFGNPSTVQAVRPSGHVAAEQVPEEHVCPEAHATPHPPQLLGSLDVFTQLAAPPSRVQRVRPSAQKHVGGGSFVSADCVFAVLFPPHDARVIALMTATIANSGERQ